MPVARPVWRFLSLLLLCGSLLITACDAPLRREALLHRLGTGAYATFTVTFYRYAPVTMKGFAAEISPSDYFYERVLMQGPLERLELRYEPKRNRTRITRTGNALDADRKMVSTRVVAGRGPLEEAIRLLKDTPQAGDVLFARDVYAGPDSGNPEYFRLVDQALRRRIERQGGSYPDWQFVEFNLEYALPQTGLPVYTAEAALIPLTGDSPTPLTAALQTLAEREFGQLPDPLLDKAF